jgi:hypothetical protein
MVTEVSVGLLQHDQHWIWAANSVITNVGSDGYLEQQIHHDADGEFGSF